MARNLANFALALCWAGCSLFSPEGGVSVRSDQVTYAIGAPVTVTISNEMRKSVWYHQICDLSGDKTSVEIKVQGVWTKILPDGCWGNYIPPIEIKSGATHQFVRHHNEAGEYRYILALSTASNRGAWLSWDKRISNSFMIRA